MLCSLPSEIIQLIALYLNETDLVSFFSLSRSCFSLSHKSIFWRELSLTHAPHYLIPDCSEQESYRRLGVSRTLFFGPNKIARPIFISEVFRRASLLIYPVPPFLITEGDPHLVPDIEIFIYHNFVSLVCHSTEMMMRPDILQPFQERKIPDMTERVVKMYGSGLALPLSCVSEIMATAQRQGYLIISERKIPDGVMQRYSHSFFLQRDEY